MKLLNIRKDEKEPNDFILTVQYRYLIFKTEVQYYGRRMAVTIGSKREYLDGYSWTLLPYHKLVSDYIAAQLNEWLKLYRQEQKGKL